MKRLSSWPASLASVSCQQLLYNVANVRDGVKAAGGEGGEEEGHVAG